MRLLTASPGAIAEAARALRNGAVVAYPTDTLYGLAVDPRQAAAVQRLFALKGRDPSSAIPLIASTLEQARTAGEFSPADLRLAHRFWPGPLTLVVPAKAGVVSVLLGAGSTIGIRVPAHVVAAGLAAELGFCVTSTSANRSGRPAPTSADHVVHDLGDAVGGVDIVIDGGPAPGGPPSTIVELTDRGPRLIRAGAVPWERVLESLQ